MVSSASVQFAEWQHTWLASAQEQLGSDVHLSEAQTQLLRFTSTHSPYLRALLLKHPDIFLSCTTQGATKSWQAIDSALDISFAEFNELSALATYLRKTKQRAALLIALADISEKWNLNQVTVALSQLAEHSVQLALEFLLNQAATKGEITLPHPAQPTKESGIIVLGMGKLGAYELNYSSDVDLIIFYEPSRLNYQGRHNEQHFLNKLAQELVKLLQDRTADGYVFRADLRLRPDPSSTPLAVSVDAALQYYENLGQNWERAAMIKARATAGDIAAGNKLLKSLGAYVWRKNLDFASIQDILSIKRQIGKKIGTQEQLYGHNIKLGKGGIREIEFFVQLHQLIWGGRQQELRDRGTISTLNTLLTLGHINDTEAQLLTKAYEFYRKLEHRLQMVEDQQTHNMPENQEEFANIASLMGYAEVEEFAGQLERYINTVHTIFAASFDTHELSMPDGNLVFTGTSHDPDTLKTLEGMGFSNTTNISQTIMDWHRGSRRCTRSKVARQLLTELVPDILLALSKTISPDEAFIRFDQFLLELPVGIQLFSLITNNPDVLHLIADIMGTAPTLSTTLSRRPQLIETTLFSGFYHDLPTKSVLLDELRSELEPIEHYDLAMEKLRQFKNEKHFQAGVQLLRSITGVDEIGRYLSDLADILIDMALKLTLDEFATQYGSMAAGRCCIIALGKLGSQELTFGSDVDLMFVYDAPDGYSQADSKQSSQPPSTYYNRLCQRIINALTAIGTNGALYEVDTRLRPSGGQGLLAVNKQALTQYFSKDAWTFERMALCKARAMAGNTQLQHEVDAEILTILNEPRDKAELKQNIKDMRLRVEEEFGTDDPWKVKYVAGGLMDVDFVAQYILLAAAHQFPRLNLRSSRHILMAALKNPALQQSLKLSTDDLTALLNASTFLMRLQHMLRLTSENSAMLDHPPTGLAKMLTNHMQLGSYDELKNAVQAIENQCRAAYMGVMLVQTEH